MRLYKVCIERIETLWIDFGMSHIIDGVIQMIDAILHHAADVLGRELIIRI